MATNGMNKPHYAVFGKINGDRRNWVQVGVGWHTASRRTGVPYVRLQLNALPLGFDGVLAIHEVREPGADDRPARDDDDTPPF